MKKIFSSMLSALVVAMFAFAGLASGQTQVAQIERPTMVVGEVFAYHVINDWDGSVQEKFSVTVTKVTDKEVTYLRRSEKTGAEVEIVETLDLNTIVGFSESLGARKSYVPHSGFFNFPLSAGKAWEAKASYTIEGIAEGVHTFPGKVVGWETVTVPAGTFTALKVVLDGRYNFKAPTGWKTSTGTMQAAVWFVPGIKRPVKEEYRTAGSSGSANTKTSVVLVPSSA